MSKLWFSLYDRKEYTGNEPAFYDTGDLNFAKLFEDNWLLIKSELEAYLKNNQLQSYFNTTMVDEQHSWKTISLKWWGINFYKNQNDFPKTTKLLTSVEGLVSASFNLLQSGGKIKPHCGDTNGIYRVHLGLEIPAVIPECGFRVRDEWRSWKEGKVLVFVDANNHEAINLSSRNRFIFLFDVVRPEFRKRKNYISSTVISSLFIQKRAESVKLLYKSPLWVQKTVGFLLVPLAYVSIRLRNSLFSVLKK
ncbi:MAG: aspartyl/asparaginyl beta-hydroxylase domain-containing protein [Bacteroidota bacterium]